MSKSARVASKLVKWIGTPVAELPVFLCPGLVRTTHLTPRPCSHNSSLKPLVSQRGLVSSNAIIATNGSDRTFALRNLPQQCGGCGALSQTADEAGAGYYTLGRNTVRRYLEAQSGQNGSAEDEIVREALKQVDTASIGVSKKEFVEPGTFSKIFTVQLAILTLVQRLLSKLPSAIDAIKFSIIVLESLYIIPLSNLFRIQSLNLLISTTMYTMSSMRQTFPCR